MAAPLKHLDHELDVLCLELRSEKATNRHKAFEKLDTMLNNRSADMEELMCREDYQENDCTWDRLFDSCFSGILTQIAKIKESRGRANALEGKNYSYIMAIQKVLNTANKNEAFVSLEVIMKKVFRFFDENCSIKEFLTCFIQILHKHVIISKFQQFSVTVSEWSRILSYCFQLNSENKISKIIVATCISAALENSICYANMIDDILQYIPSITNIVTDFTATNDAIKTQNEWLKIVFLCCQTLAVDYRFVICKFTEDVLQKLHSIYDSMDENTKITYYKLLHLAIVVHHPDVNNAKMDYAVTTDVWNKHLRNAHYIVEKEINAWRVQKSFTYNNNVPKICEYFVHFATRLSYLIFWSDDVWKSNADQSNEKRVKRAYKMQALLDNITLFNSKTNKKYCWRSFIILAELIHQYPQSVLEEDYQPLLDLLSNYQDSIEYPSERKAFYKLCFQLLKNEDRLIQSNIIDLNYCKNTWSKIAENTSRLSLTNNANAENHHILLQLLLEYKKFDSPNFITTIINAFTSHTVIRTDITFQTIIRILENFNVDSLKDSKDVITRLMDYVQPKLVASDLRLNFMTSNKISSNITAQLYVMCCLVKTDVIDFGGRKTESATDTHWLSSTPHLVDIQQIENNMRIKMTDKLAMEDFNFKDRLSIGSKLKGLPNEVKCILIESFTTKLCEKVVTGIPEMSENGDIDLIISNVQRLLSTVELKINIVNELISYEALKVDNYEKFLLTKRIGIELQGVEMYFDVLKTKTIEDCDTLNLLKCLSSIFSTKYHSKLCSTIRNNSFENLVEWLDNIVERKFNIPKSETIEIKPNEKKSDELECRHAAIGLIVDFSQFNGENQQQLLESFLSVEFNLANMIEFSFALETIHRILLEFEPSDELADFTMDIMKNVCRSYNKYEDICELLIDMYSAYIHFIRDLPDFVNNSRTILATFLDLCVRNKFSMTFTIKVMRQVKYFYKAFPNQIGEAAFGDICTKLMGLLNSNSLVIQLGVIESLTYLFNSFWLDGNLIDDEMTLQREFHKILFDGIPWDAVQEDKENAANKLDYDQNKCAIMLQLLGSIISVNAALRNRASQQFFEICYKNDIEKDKIRPFFNKIIEHSGYDFVGFYDMIVPSILSGWITKGYPIERFPWFLSKSKTQKNFFLENMNFFSISILRHKSSLIKDFSRLIEIDINNLIQPVLSNCIAYMIPIKADCSNISAQYKQNGISMNKLILESQIDASITHDNIHEILKHLLINVYDEIYFEKLFKFQLLFNKEDHILSAEQLKICYQYLIKTLKIENCKSLFVFFCINQPYNIEYLLLEAKIRVKSTKIVQQKLLCFFQYCVLIDLITEFLVLSENSKKNEDCKHFLIREICHFLCNLMKVADEGPENQQLRLAACNFFYRFSNLTAAKCSSIFLHYVNYIVAFLIPLCKDTNIEVVEFALDIIRYLVVDQNKYFASSIKLLDNFPADEIFDKFREVHMMSKYKDHNFSLTEEINHFLLLENRRLEGFIELKEKLATRKTELFEIFRDLSTKFLFSEHCNDSIIHKLINVLIKNLNSNDESISLEVVKCLGELGPSDLNTMVLKSSSQSSIYKAIESYEEAIENMISVIIEKLNDLIINDDISVANASSVASYHIFKSNVARKFSDKFIHLYPYAVKNNKNSKLLHEADENLDILSILLMDEFADSETWIQRTCCYLFKIFNEKELMELAGLNVSFAEELLPLLIQTLLSFGIANFRQKLKEFISFFFDTHYKYQNSGNIESKTTVYMNEFIIKTMINLAECIRIYNQNFPDNFIQLNYLHIAKAAQYCQAHFTCIIYCEIHALGKLGESEDQTIRDKVELDDIMYEAHLSIGITDAVEAFIDPVKNRFKYLQHQKSKNRLLHHYDAQCTSEKPIGNSYADCLYNANLFAVSKTLMEYNEKKFECAWRMSDWDELMEIGDKLKSVNLEYEYEKHHYLALRCLAKDEIGTSKAILEARKCIISAMRTSTLECTANIYKCLSKLQQLQQIEDFAKIHFIKSQNSHINLITKWQEQDRIPYNDFTYIEPVLTQRICILSRAGIRATRSWVPEVVQNTFFELIKEARKNNSDNVAIRNIAQMYSLEMNKDMQAKLMIEDSQLNFASGDLNLAKKILMEVLKEKSLNILTKAVALRIHGEYLAETSSEEYRVIHNKFFRMSVELIENYAIKNNKAESLKTGKFNDDDVSRNLIDVSKTYEVTAKYVDREYVHLNNEMKSLNFLRKEERLLNNKTTLSKMKENLQQMSHDEKVCMSLLKKTTHIDEQEIENIKEEKDKRATLALIYYIRYSLANPDASNLCIFRIITLWLANKHVKDIKSLITERLHYIPSYRFLELLPQITPRLGDENEDVSNSIASILERCALDHPYHTLNHIFSLANSYKDETETGSSSEQEPRVIKAQKLMKKLSKNDKIADIIKQQTLVSDTLITLANKDISSRDKTKQKIKLTSGEGLLRLKSLNFIHCPTVHLPISVDCEYKKIISIEKWSDHIFLVGGINSPKKLECLCSDGIVRPQLLKGKDDLRQDAVMQQVFTIMNKLLLNDKETKKRKLTIRTYKVVPLSRRSGILEWCLNTIPIGAYLVSNGRIKGAHELYRPKDWPARSCFEKMKNSSTQSSEKRLKVFEEICNNIKPVFHRFFFDNFCNPGVWFERKLAYTNSIATTSMIGYIMGIGDRHVQNILIDKTTAEVIHIDFGIAFELGKTLNTPETVPFRLTRDIVAGFGVSGVEGIFTNACIKTMNVLRQNQQSILTILEVLLYDPLYTWNVIARMKSDHTYDCLSQYPKKVDNRSAVEAGSTYNTTAERALDRLNAKLNGKDEDITGYASVDGQVSRLIQQALNPSNLSRLFCGWQPYL